MTLLLRGRTLSFHRAPEAVDDHAAYVYDEDGAVLIQDGHHTCQRRLRCREAHAPDGVDTVDHRPHLILPGFIDAHAHMPQMQIIASFGAELLGLAEQTTPFPRRRDSPIQGTRARIARRFLDE